MGAGFMLPQTELFEDGDLAATGRNTSLVEESVLARHESRVAG
jgi:hypothetical protein